MLPIGLFARWNYRDAIPLLESFVATKHLPQRQIVAGLLNLAAALVHESRHPEAATVFTNLDEMVREVSFSRFRGNLLELKAQMAIAQKDWALAKIWLSEAVAAFGSSQGIEALFVHKWRAVLDWQSGGDIKLAFDQLRHFRQEAVRLKHFESVRDCDLLLSCAQADSSQFLQVYIGTPFESFRQMAIVRFARPVLIPRRYERVMGRMSCGPAIDLLASSLVVIGNIFKAAC